MRVPLAVGCLAGIMIAGCSGSTPPGIGVQRGPAAVSRAPRQTRSAGSPQPARSGAAASVPRPRHTVLVVFENHAFDEIIGNTQAPFINRLAADGALLTASYAVTHPSEPNYLALFSGGTHGVTSDQCPTSIRAPNLAADLLAARLTFTGYAEDLPAQGSTVCGQGNYARKHAPWTDFTDVPRSASQPFSRFPAGDFAALPTVSFVVPNLCDDMHDCSVATGDSWLRAHLGGYARWAMSHDSLLIVTWDEDDGSQANRIATIFVGQQVAPGRYGKPVDHYNVLRTIEQAYGLPQDGQAADHYPITWIWRRPG